MAISRRRFLATSSTVAAVGSLGWPARIGMANGFTSGLGSAGLASLGLDEDDKRRRLEKTEDSVKAVRRGIEFLKRARNRNGGFGPEVAARSDIGCTAMAGLALLGDGSTPVQGRHRKILQGIETFLLKKVRVMPKGNITAQTGTQLQNKIGSQAHTFFSLLFLSQIAGEAHISDETLNAVSKLTRCVVGAQKSDGSWGRESWAPTLGTVMGWTSLRSAHFAGMKVGGSPEKTAEHLLGQMSKGMANRQGWMHQLYKNATGIRVLYAMGKENEPAAKKAFKEVLKLIKDNNTAFNQAGGEEYLAFHLITETMLQKAGTDWETWFPIVRDKIIKVQNKDGSWTGHHCITSRTFCTAAAVLVLSAPNRYLPISQQ